MCNFVILRHLLCWSELAVLELLLTFLTLFPLFHQHFPFLNPFWSLSSSSSPLWTLRWSCMSRPDVALPSTFQMRCNEIPPVTHCLSLSSFFIPITRRIHPLTWWILPVIQAWLKWNEISLMIYFLSIFILYDECFCSEIKFNNSLRNLEFRTFFKNCYLSYSFGQRRY